MDRRTFISALTAGLLAKPLGASDGSYTPNFQFTVLKLAPGWDTRARALIRLSYEIQKRCNIPIESDYQVRDFAQVRALNSPFMVVSGNGPFDKPTLQQARDLRLVLNSGGILLFDDFSDKEDERFYKSAVALMNMVYPELPGPQIVPRDHTLYQSYYLLKQPRGRMDRKDYLEGWHMGNRTRVFFSHNDVLGAMDADRLGNWTYNMEIGGGFRRELCFRLCINMAYYTLTLNYKKDRAFPPVIERRRRQ